LEQSKVKAGHPAPLPACSIAGYNVVLPYDLRDVGDSAVSGSVVVPACNRSHMASTAKGTATKGPAG